MTNDCTTKPGLFVYGENDMINILDVFEYNQFFVMMMNIINKAKLLNKEGSFEKHHIIPRCWYKKNNIDVDNSENNLVCLTKEEHKKVHTLAYKCAKEQWFKRSMAYAAHIMGDSTAKYNLSEETKKKMSKVKKGHIVSEKTKEKISKANRGKNNPMYGKNMSEETKKKISKKMKGRKLSVKTKKKMSKWQKGINKSEEICNKIHNTKHIQSEMYKMYKIGNGLLKWNEFSSRFFHK